VDGITPLYRASQEGYTSLVQLLLTARADPSGGRLDGAGTEAIHVAAGGGYEDVVRLLVEAGAHVDVPDANGHTPLHHAAQASVVHAKQSTSTSTTEEGFQFAAATTMMTFDSVGALSFLLSVGAPVDALSQAGNSALHVAAMAGGTACVHALLAAGANRHLRNSRGLTAADEARRAGHSHLAEAIDAAAEARVSGAGS
jgi:ankyrin repeat protein